jgi:hypothetical protein
LIWLKRLAPFAIIFAVLVFYRYYSQKQAAKQTEIQHRYALATAQVWVASAKYRNDPDRYLQVRDSLLASCSLSVAVMDNFVESNKDRPEEFYSFSNLVTEYLDSLLDIEDSLLLAAKDSVRNASTGATR